MQLAISWQLTHSVCHAAINPFVKLVRSTPSLTLFAFALLTGPGQSSLPQACPVCLHEPVKADDCRPNKALRTTIKVFLRKKGIERDAAHKKESLDQPVTSSAVSANSLGKKAEESSISQISTIPGPEIGEVAWVGPAASSGTSNKVEKEHGLQISPAENEMDVVRSSIEVGGFLRMIRLLLMLVSLSTMKFPAKACTNMR